MYSSTGALGTSAVLAFTGFSVLAWGLWAVVFVVVGLVVLLAGKARYRSLLDARSATLVSRDQISPPR